MTIIDTYIERCRLLELREPSEIEIEIVGVLFATKSQFTLDYILDMLESVGFDVARSIVCRILWKLESVAMVCQLKPHEFIMIPPM